MTKKKFGLEDLTINLDAIKGEDEKALMKNIAEMVLDIVNKSSDGSMSKEDVEAKFKSINDDLAAAGETKYKSLIEDNNELKEQVKNLGDTIEKLKSHGLGEEFVNKFDEKLDAMLDSEKFKNFAYSNTQNSGSFDGFSLSEILATKAVSMTGNYTGDHLITRQQSNIVNQAVVNDVHVRDIMTVLPGDPKFPNLSYAQIYEINKNARFVSENGKLPESSFKVKEHQTGTKRLGTYVRMSKRMLKCRVYVRAFILNMLPEAISQAEDWNILFGDGAGENLDGIAHVKGVMSVETIIGGAIVSGEGGSITNVEGYDENKSCIVTLAKPYDEIRDGMMITFSGASTNTSLNKTYPVLKINDTQLLLKGCAFSTNESAKGSMTFKVNHAAFKSIPEPNSGDAVEAAFAVMTYGEFRPNVMCLNPIDVLAISCEKDTTGRPLDLVKGQGNFKTVKGYPVLVLDQVAPGTYFLGDFRRGVQLVDYTNLQLEWAEDVECKLANQVVCMIQEELILAVYNPFSFAVGKLDDLKTAITKA